MSESYNIIREQGEFMDPVPLDDKESKKVADSVENKATSDDK